jgi:hypothetical protein
MGEHLVYTQGVAGSSPVLPTTTQTRVHTERSLALRVVLGEGRVEVHDFRGPVAHGVERR